MLKDWFSILTRDLKQCRENLDDSDDILDIWSKKYRKGRTHFYTHMHDVVILLDFIGYILLMQVADYMIM